MITAQKLNAWRKLRRYATIADRVVEERSGISYADWTQLEELVSRVRSDFQGLTSPSFAAQTNHLLAKSTESNLVAQEVRRIALSAERTPGETTARSFGIVAAWVIWTTSLVLGFTHRLPQLIVVLCSFAGFVPYIVSIKYVEPWFHRRATEQEGAAPPNSA